MNKLDDNNSIIEYTFGSLTVREWQDIIMLIHKYETHYEDFQRGRKRGGQSGLMDKIIRESIPFNKIQELEEKVRTIIFALDNENSKLPKTNLGSWFVSGT